MQKLSKPIVIPLKRLLIRYFYSVFCGTVWQTVQFHLLHTRVLGEKSLFFKKKKKEMTLFSICLSSCEISALMRQQCACRMHLLLNGEMQAVVTNPIQKHLSAALFTASFLNHLAMLEQHLKPTPSRSLLLELSGLIQSL